MELKSLKLVLVVAVIAGITMALGTSQSLDAQISNNITDPSTSNTSEMMTSKDHPFMNSFSKGDKNKDNWTSSVSIFQPIINSFKSAIQVSINDAITAAESAVGENSTTVAAYLHPERQYIVYNILALDSSGIIHKVLIDPGNGNVLDDQQMSFMELMTMIHGKGMMDHDKMMGSGPGMGMGMMDHDKMMGSGPGMGMGMMDHYGN